MRKIVCGIYKITNTDNGKMYVGQSNDIYDRWYHHKSELKNNRHENSYLQYSYNLHGENAYVFEIIEECLESELNEREIYWIDKLRTYVGFDDCNGYNLTLGGEGTRTVHPVLQFDLLGNFVKEWQNGIIASKNTGINVGIIYGCCVKHYKRADKYIFVYKENYNSIDDLVWYLSSNKMKPINQYDLDGNLIRQWNGVAEITRELGYTPNGSILKITMSYNGFVFRYADDIDDLTSEYFKNARDNIEKLKSREFGQYDISGNLIKTYSSLRDAKKDGYSMRMISECLRGIRNAYKGYVWVENNVADKITPEYCNTMINSVVYKKTFYSVIQCDLDGNYIKEYEYLKDVQKDGFKNSNVRDCCMGYIKQYKGYIWKFGEEKIPSNSKPVIQFDKSNNYIDEFPSILIASQKTGINKSNIQSVCKGRQKTTGGYIFRYKEVS